MSFYMSAAVKAVSRILLHYKYLIHCLGKLGHPDDFLVSLLLSEGHSNVTLEVAKFWAIVCKPWFKTIAAS